MRKDKLWWVTFGLICSGLLLWVINWWANRPLFLDEANIARNLYDRSFAGLFYPLDHRQYAPPLYLVVAKACGELFGYTERSLRLPAMLGGLMAIYGLHISGKALKLGWWILLPLALLFVNPTVLRYVGELKPYGLDLGVGALLLGHALRGSRPGWQWSLAGIVAIWCSLPAVFVLAAIGLYSLFSAIRSKDDQRTGLVISWLITGASWLVAFGVLYFQVLAPSVGSKYLNVFHTPYFFPLPGAENFWSTAGRLIVDFPKLAFGYTAVAIAMGFAVLTLALLRPRWKLSPWLVLPVGVVMLASVFGFYSLLPRLLLFTLPGWWILAAQVSQKLTTRLPCLGLVAVMGLWLVILGGTNVVRHFVSPEVFSGSRDMVWKTEPGYKPILHHSAAPAYDYYQRIHPAGPQLPATPSISSIRGSKQPGKYVLLYDVMTQANVRVDAKQDSLWAAERRCSVRSVSYLRAKALYLVCD